MSDRETFQPDEALDRLLVEASWPEPSDESVARLVQYWRSLNSVVVIENGEPLDRLLVHAEWPRPGRASVDRMTACWVGVSRGRHSRSSWWGWSAAAAVLLVAGGTLWWGLSPRNERIADNPASSNARPPRPAAATTPTKITASRSIDDAPSWRPPNAYELVLVTAVRRERASADANTRRTVERTTMRSRRPAKIARKSRPSRTAQPASELGTVASILGSIRAISKLLEDLSCERAEVALLERVRTSNPVQRKAALRVLVPIATSSSLPLLRAAVASSDLRSTVMPAMLRLEDSARLGELAFTETDSELRQQIMATLWQREDPRALAFMFALVSNRAHQADALVALDMAARPPVEWLCQIVGQSPRASDRTTAAELLGRLNRPEATKCLIALSQDAAGRQAALTGLLASSEPTAREFVAAAENDPYLIASIRSIRHHQTNHSITVPGESPHGTP